MNKKQKNMEKSMIEILIRNRQLYVKSKYLILRANI